MKIVNAPHVVEMSNDFVEKSFSVGDAGMIFEILRSKMYSNAVYAVCREISANARDAHREVGKATLPIHIQLPSGLDPTLRIKDFGPGISPDRIENVYIKYANSTKRADNTQQGGWGLGAKSVFAYADAFSITTIVDGTRYNYTCFIDETKVGKLVLVDKSQTDDVNGTEIIIPVKSSDISGFKQWMEFSTRHWAVKPVFTGNTIEYTNYIKTLTGTDWFIVNNNRSYYNSSVHAIVDDVEYEVPRTALSPADLKIVDSYHGSIYLIFGIGVVSLSASREQLNVDERTIHAIRARLGTLLEATKKSVQTKVNEASSLWDAFMARKEAYKVFRNEPPLGNMLWRGITLPENAIHNILSNFISKQMRRDNFRGKVKTRSYDTVGVVLEPGSLLILNDIDADPSTITGKHLSKFLELHPEHENKVLYIFSNDIGTNSSWAKNQIVQNLEFGKLSEFYSKPKTRGPTGPRMLIYKVSEENSRHRSTFNFFASSLEAYKNEPGHKVLITLSVTEQNDKYCTFNGRQIDGNDFSRICKAYPSVTFFGVMDSVPADKITKELGKYEKFEDWAKSIANNEETQKAIEEHLSKSYIHEAILSLSRTRYTANVLAQLPASSLFKSELSKYNKTLDCEDMSNVIQVLNILGMNHERKLDAISSTMHKQSTSSINSIFKKYPLIEPILSAGYQTTCLDYKIVLQYIQLIDSEKKC
jgi:Histidine kinase-, DNA gyrase B-, and HSP90-like ATPase